MTITTAAKYDVITLEEAKQHLRIYHDNQDALIQLKLKQAVEFVENYCNHFMAEKEICKEYDSFPSNFDLLPGPVSSITKVEYLANITDAAYTELASTYYKLMKSGFRYKLVATSTWPTPASAAGSVKVTFKAGYSAPSSIPLTLKAGVFIILSNLYENPTDQIVGRSATELPKGFEFVVSSQIIRNV